MLARIATKSAALSIPSAKTASEWPKWPASSFMTIRTALIQKPAAITLSAMPNRSYLFIDLGLVRKSGPLSGGWVGTLLLLAIFPGVIPDDSTKSSPNHHTGESRYTELLNNTGFRVKPGMTTYT